MASPVPAFLQQLVDDAATYPPGNADLGWAVPAHRAHRRAAYADLVGLFVVNDVALPELIKVLAATPPAESTEPLAVAVVVTGGAGAIEGAVRWAERAPALDLRRVEFALRDEDDLVHNARRVGAALDQLAGELGDDVEIYIEPPRLFGARPTPSWLGALDEVAGRDYRLKFRTGGLSADAFPTAAELAVCIESALDREVAFKSTAGTHRARRHRDEETGFEQHGFLSLLLATRASLDGATVAEVAAVLDDPDPTTLTDRLASAGPEALASARRWFTCFGSCSILEPLEDLVALGLLPGLRPEARRLETQ